MPVIKYSQLYSYGRIIFKDYLLKKEHKVTLYDGNWSCNCKNQDCKQIIKGKKREDVHVLEGICREVLYEWGYLS